MTTETTSDTTVPNRIDRTTLGLVALVVAPLLARAVHLLAQFGATYHAISDNAQNELMVRAVGHHAVLLGPFSRDGWNHPGPFLYYLTWLPYHVLGSTSTAFLVCALLVNGAAAAAMVLIARRHGGTVLAVLVTLGLVTLTLTFPDTFLHDPWNPYITVYPFGAFVMLVWATTNRDRWAFAAACAVGTFCVQTHVGYAAAVGVLLLVAMVAAVRRAPAGGRPRLGDQGAIGLGLVVLVVLWAPAVIQQLVGDPGNLREIIHYFRHPTEPGQTFGHAWRAMAAQFTLDPDWLVRLHPISPFSGEPTALLERPVPVLLIPFAIASIVAVRRGPRPFRTFALVLVVTIAVGTVSLAQIIGPMYEYRLRWIWLLAMLCMAFTAAVGAALVTRWRAFPPVAGRVVAVLTVVAIVGLSAFGIARATDVVPPQLTESHEIVALTREVRSRLPHRRGSVLVRASSFGSFGPVKGLLLTLDRAGIPTRVPNDPGDRLGFGDWRTATSGPRRAELVVAIDRDIDDVARLPGYHLVAYRGVLPYRDRAAVAARFRQRFRKRIELNAEAARFTARLQGTAVFLVEPGPSTG
ncbi:MAG: hypothetical protein ACXVK4_12445 [Acidimicrobiia bacterium]